MTTIMKWIEWLDCGPVGNQYPGYLINLMLQRRESRWYITERELWKMK